MKVDSRMVRSFSVFAVPVILITAYLFFIRPSQLRWGATTEEIRRSMPGDDLVANPTFLATRAITIRGRPEDIWPWIAQMGFDRAGTTATTSSRTLAARRVSGALNQFCLNYSIRKQAMYFPSARSRI
jgi:hypothetical protein